MGISDGKLRIRWWDLTRGDAVTLRQNFWFTGLRTVPSLKYLSTTWFGNQPNAPSNSIRKMVPGVDCDCVQDRKTVCISVFPVWSFGYVDLMFHRTFFIPCHLWVRLPSHGKLVNLLAFMQHIYFNCAAWVYANTLALSHCYFVTHVLKIHLYDVAMWWLFKPDRTLNWSH